MRSASDALVCGSLRRYLRAADRHVGRILADLLERSGEVRHGVGPLVLADAVPDLSDGISSRVLCTRDQDEALLLAVDVALSGLLQPPQG